MRVMCSKTANNCIKNEHFAVSFLYNLWIIKLLLPGLFLNANYRNNDPISALPGQAFRKSLEKSDVSSINVVGLSLSLACSLFNVLRVNDEYNVDTFQKNGSRLNSVFERQYEDRQVETLHPTPGLLVVSFQAMKTTMPTR